MGKLRIYLKESYDELVHHVTWPTWKQLIATAGLVLVSSILIAFIIFGVDALIGLILRYTFYR